MPDLAAIRARYEAATDGEWVPSVSGTVLWSGAVAVFETPTFDGLSREQRQANIEFAAHARTDIPLLVEALEEAQGKIDAVRELRARILRAGGSKRDGWWIDSLARILKEGE